MFNSKPIEIGNINKIIEEISELSAYSKWINTDACLNKMCSCHYMKEVQSYGAAIQNMLLTAHDMRIGSCCGEDLLEKADAVSVFLRADDYLELMEVVFLE